MAKIKPTGLFLKKGAKRSSWRYQFEYRERRYRGKVCGGDMCPSAAAEMYGAMRSDIFRGQVGIGIKPAAKKDLLFEKAAELVLEWMKTTKRPQSVTTYGFCVKGLSRTFGGKKLSEIVPFGVEAHKKMRKDEGHLVQCNNELAALSVIFNRCIQWGKFEGSNPATKKKVKRFDIGLTRTRWLSEDEETRLVAECSEPLRSIVLIGIYSGLRVRSKVLTLKPDCIDLKHRTVTIEGAYSKNKRTRTLPMHSALVEVFERLLQTKGEFLFTNQDGSRLKGIRGGFDAACQRAKIKGATPHTLRHTFASRLAMAGVGSVSLQQLGRWESLSMINRYAHLSPGHLTESLERLGCAAKVPHLGPTVDSKVVAMEVVKVG